MGLVASRCEVKVVEVSTVCTATVEELWVLGRGSVGRISARIVAARGWTSPGTVALNDEEAALVEESPEEVLTLLAQSDVKVIHVENTNVRDEEDRESQ